MFDPDAASLMGYAYTGVTLRPKEIRLVTPAKTFLIKTHNGHQIYPIGRPTAEIWGGKRRLEKFLRFHSDHWPHALFGADTEATLLHIKFERQNEMSFMCRGWMVIRDD